MLISTPWQQQTFDLPAGLSSCYAEVFGDWLYVGGVTPSAPATYISKFSDGGRTLGPWGTWGVDKGSAVAGTGCWKLPSGLYGVKSDRSFWHISTPGQTVARTLGAPISPVTIATQTVTRGGVPVQPAFNSFSGSTTSLYLRFTGLVSGDPRVVLQRNSADAFLDVVATSGTTGRKLIIWDDMLFSLGGVATTILTPLMDLRASHISDDGILAGDWFSIGQLPGVFPEGLNRFCVARWRDWLIVVGGSVVAASATSSSAGVWATKVSPGGPVSAWVQLQNVPTTNRNAVAVVIGNYLHVIGGIPDGVTGTGPYSASIYTTQLQEIQG